MRSKKIVVLSPEPSQGTIYWLTWEGGSEKPISLEWEMEFAGAAKVAPAIADVRANTYRFAPVVPEGFVLRQEGFHKRWPLDPLEGLSSTPWPGVYHLPA